LVIQLRTKKIKVEMTEKQWLRLMDYLATTAPTEAIGNLYQIIGAQIIPDKPNEDKLDKLIEKTLKKTPKIKFDLKDLDDSEKCNCRNCTLNRQFHPVVPQECERRMTRIYE